MSEGPEVGDLLLLDGRMRRITIVNEQTGVVEFDHPIPEDEEARRKTMRAWKARRDDWCNALVAGVQSGAVKVPGMDRVPTFDEVDAAYRTIEPPPEMSRKGAVGVQWLDWFEGANFWGVRDRIDGKKYRAGSVIVAPAASIAAAQAAPAIVAAVTPTSEG